VILCLAALAGCGGPGGTAQFTTGYTAARGSLNAVLLDANATLTSTPRKSADQIATRMDALADRFGHDLASLAALKPPATVATAFVTLTTSLKRVESDLRAVSVAAKRRNLAGTVLAAENLDSDARAAADAATAIKQKLYTR
jgi:hypothetical protein